MVNCRNLRKILSINWKQISLKIFKKKKKLIYSDLEWWSSEECGGRWLWLVDFSVKYPANRTNVFPGIPSNYMESICCQQQQWQQEKNNKTNQTKTDMMLMKTTTRLTLTDFQRSNHDAPALWSWSWAWSAATILPTEHGKPPCL